MYGFIYITTNTVNNKHYLGMCNYHKKNHKTYIGSGKALRRAIKKYGKDAFTRTVIYEASTKEELSQKEIELIEYYKCVEDRNWYNIASGGYTTRGFPGKKHSKETIEKMKKNHKRVLTKEGAKRIGDSARKRMHKIRVQLSGKDHGKSVSVTINNITYGSLLEAVRKTGLTYHQVRKIKYQSCAQ